MPRIGALAPWFGGKRTLAPRIVQQLGKHTQYFEPFCGSMAVLFAKDPSQKETVCDLHGDLVNLAHVVQSNDAPLLYDRLQRAMFAESLLQEAGERLEKEPVPAEVSIDRAYWYFLACWMGWNGTAGTARLDYQIAVRWTAGGGSPTVRFRNAVESMPAWHQRLRNVVILCRNAFGILDRFEDVAGTAIYVDPPYPEETRSKGSIKNGRGGKYLHEFYHGTAKKKAALFEKDDVDQHELLAEILRGYRKARIIVSSYDCERIRELYDGWTFIDCHRQKHLHAQNGRGARKLDAPEVLIVNGPLFPQEAQS